MLHYYHHLVSGAVGVSAEDESWANANMPLSCKTARSNGKAPEVSMARLCCKLNCSNPAGRIDQCFELIEESRDHFSYSHRSDSNHFSRFALRNAHTQVNHTHESSPKYIQHLALLI